MWSRPESEEALINRLLPEHNPDTIDRRSAWNEWQHSPAKNAILRFIQVYNNTQELDEDILQEALLIAFLEVETGGYEYRAGIPFSAYVKGIARNKIREARRRESHLVPVGEEILLRFPDEAHRPLDDVLEHREQKERLRQGLARLPKNRRTVLERFIQGESTAEIAAALEISRESVRQHKSRGVRRLQELGLFG